MKSLQEYLNESLFGATNIPNNIKKELKSRNLKEWLRIFNSLGDNLDMMDIEYYDDEDFWPAWERLFKQVNKNNTDDIKLIGYFDSYIDGDMVKEIWDLLTQKDPKKLLDDFDNWCENN